jgi:hypothetical protein
MRPHSFALEQLEDRALFSVAASAELVPLRAATAPAVAATAKATTPLTGAFNIAGTYTHPIGNPDTGSRYLFKGAGNKKSLGGNFTMTGHVAAPGFVQNGRSSGYLTIITAHGKLVLRVQGPPQNPGVLPPSLFFRVSSGTGSYAHSAGRGHITLSASDATHKFLFRFNPPT